MFDIVPQFFAFLLLAFSVVFVSLLLASTRALALVSMDKNTSKLAEVLRRSFDILYGSYIPRNKSTE